VDYRQILSEKRDAEITQAIMSIKTFDEAAGFLESMGLPFGYILDGERLAKNENEAAVITHVVYLRNTGKTLQEIADTLNAEGISTKRGGRWYPTTVKNILERVAMFSPPPKKKYIESIEDSIRKLTPPEQVSTGPNPGSFVGPEDELEKYFLDQSTLFTDIDDI